ncbi:MAG TPA: hypothetical protein VMH48_10615 [Methylomirabilota bacterium]|nr:hypothetical protein [Methylomirabilota bacterium]
MPSGNGGKLELESTENAYGGEPPLAVMVQPEYAAPCVPPGQEMLEIVSAPPEDVVTVTVACAVFEPEEFVAVRV